MVAPRLVVGSLLVVAAACGGEPDDGAECGVHGAADGDRCACEAGYTGAHCTECLDGYQLDGTSCVPLPTSWQPYTADENFDRANQRITGFPAIISYTDSGEYPTHIGTLRHLEERPVGACEVVPNALLGVAPSLRCTWTETYETSANPAIGGDPYGYGQTYLGPGSVNLDASLGNVTALSIGFVWRFGDGWLDAMAAREAHRDEEMYDGVTIGGSGGKPLITHREDCEYWYDVTASIPASGSQQYTGTLTAPNGIERDSVELVAGGSFVRAEDGTLYVGNDAIGTIQDTGAYSFQLPASFPSGALQAFYRTRPPGDDPSQARYQQNGAWRRPLASNSCRERPMMLSRLVERDDTTPLPVMSLTAADDIACYCWDFHDGACHDPTDLPAAPVQFRIGSSERDDPGAGIYHVGVAEPMFVELRIDPTNNVLEQRVTTPDGRFNDTVISRSSFCDSPDNGAIRGNPNPHRWGRLITMGEPFWTLPLTSIPANAWHEVGQWRITGAVDGPPLAPQGPPAGFVRQRR